MKPIGRFPAPNPAGDVANKNVKNVSLLCINRIIHLKKNEGLWISEILKHLKQPIFIDGRNQYEPAEMRSLGFTYLGMGIPSSLETTLSTLQATLYTKEDHAHRSLSH